MALRLVELLVDRTAAEATQLMIEYDPQPPFDAGSPASGRTCCSGAFILAAAGLMPGRRATHVTGRRG